MNTVRVTLTEDDARYAAWILAAQTSDPDAHRIAHLIHAATQPQARAIPAREYARRVFLEPDLTLPHA